jgi:hypothetical protein
MARSGAKEGSNNAKTREKIHSILRMNEVIGLAGVGCKTVVGASSI